MSPKEDKDISNKKKVEILTKISRQMVINFTEITTRKEREQADMDLDHRLKQL